MYFGVSFVAARMRMEFAKRDGYTTLLTAEERLDDLGRLPSLAGFRKMRRDKGAYEFFMKTFAKAVYGIDSLYSEVYGTSITWDASAAAFTENDEAWTLFILEDNWAKWEHKAKKDYRGELEQHGLEVAGWLLSDTEDSSVDSEGNFLDEEEDTILQNGAGGGTRFDRVPVVRVLVVNSLYSNSKNQGINQKGHNRFESLELLVAEDREERGEEFFIHMKDKVKGELIVQKGKRRGAVLEKPKAKARRMK